MFQRKLEPFVSLISHFLLAMELLFSHFIAVAKCLCVETVVQSQRGWFSMHKHFVSVLIFLVSIR